jgi:hypothetical protein
MLPAKYAGGNLPAWALKSFVRSECCTLPDGQVSASVLLPGFTPSPFHLFIPSSLHPFITSFLIYLGK